MGREKAAARKLTKNVEVYDAKKRPLLPLSMGDFTWVQNGKGSHPGRWDRTGMVVERLEHRQYLIKLDGSGRVVLRNRRHLWRSEAPSKDRSAYALDGTVGPVEEAAGQDREEPLLIPGGFPGAKVIHPVDEGEPFRAEGDDEVRDTRPSNRRVVVAPDSPGSEKRPSNRRVIGAQGLEKLGLVVNLYSLQLTRNKIHANNARSNIT